jgi:L-fucose mutarotase
VLSVTGVLKVLLDAANFESAAVMVMETGQEAPIVTEFRSLLPAGTKLDLLGRQEFYQAVSSPKTTVIIATGEQRLYANLLLTVGVVKA